MIDAVHDLGGTYDLAYRPHAMPEQFLSAYPKAQDFVALKRQLDLRLRFRNAVRDRYLAAI